jgi:Cu-Zn family superoxide dismutase
MIGPDRKQGDCIERNAAVPTATSSRVNAGRAYIFYAPDFVFIRDRAAALKDAQIYIGDGATLTRSFIRRRGKTLIGRSPVRTQLTWCTKEGVPRAIITRCGSEIVMDEERRPRCSCAKWPPNASKRAAPTIGWRWFCAEQIHSKPRLDSYDATKYDVHNMNSFSPSLIAPLFLSLAFAMAHAQTPAPKSPPPLKAVAVLHPTAENKVSGTVTFTEEADGVRVQADITGLSPGKHGFHVHEFGDCTAADLASAGGHFNPTNKPHAGPDAAQRHAGDMGNVEADASGAAKLDYVDHEMSLTNDERSVIGRSVIVHAKADDLKSQPAGDSGARIACGVIGRAKSQ